MGTKDTVINVGLLAAGGVAIAAASGVYGKGSRAIRGMRYTLAYGGDNDSTIHVSGTFKPYSKAVDSAKKLAKRIGRTVEVREEGYDLVAFVEPSGRVDDGGYGKGSRAKMDAQGLISRLSQIPGVSRAFVSDTWHDGYNRITVVLKTQGTIPVTVEARGAHQNLHQISDYAKTAAAVRAAAKASGLFVEGVVGPKKIYEYVRPQYRRAGDKRESGFDGKEMYVEVYEGKGSMTRDGSYEATLMFDADEDDPTRIAQQRLMASPFAQQARPLTAEPPRITSAQGSAARGSSSVLRGMAAGVYSKGSRAARWVPDGDGFRRTDVHPGDEVEVLYVKGINMYRINMYLPYVKCAGHVLNFDAALPLAKAKYEASQAYDTQRAYNDYIRRSRN